MECKFLQEHNESAACHSTRVGRQVLPDQVCNWSSHLEEACGSVGDVLGADVSRFNCAPLRLAEVPVDN